MRVGSNTLEVACVCSVQVADTQAWSIRHVPVGDPPRLLHHWGVILQPAHDRLRVPGDTAKQLGCLTQQRRYVVHGSFKTDKGPCKTDSRKTGWVGSKNKRRWGKIVKLSKRGCNNNNRAVGLFINAEESENKTKNIEVQHTIDFSYKLSEVGFGHHLVVTLAVTINFTFHHGDKKPWGFVLYKSEAYEGKKKRQLLAKFKIPQFEPILRCFYRLLGFTLVLYFVSFSFPIAPKIHFTALKQRF